MNQKRVTIALAVIASLLALGLTLYPIISNYVNQRYASQIHTAYQEVMEQTDDAALERAKELAIVQHIHHPRRNTGRLHRGRTCRRFGGL